jgi:hypothetical protein
MHDPQTVAFEIRYPWKKYGKSGRNDFERNYRESFITIWHVDPEKDGSDDSCDWSGRKLNAKEKALAARLIDNKYDNLRTFFSTFIPQACPKHGMNHDECDVNDDDCNWGEFAENVKHDEMKSRIGCIFSCYKREFRWRYPVRWHFWHWKIQVHPVQQFKRWAFSRCCKCGGRFTWGYCPCTNSWNGTGPRWFRGEKDIYHSDCGGTGQPQASRVGTESE